MKGIDPKYVMYLGLLVTIEQAIGHGTVSLTNLVPMSWAPYITSWCNFLAFVGTVIMTYQASVSSSQAGPLVNTPIAPSVLKVLLIAFLLSAVLIPSAFAQGRKPNLNLPFDPLKLNNLTSKLPIGSGLAASANSAAALPCDFKMLIQLTPDNLVPTIKACLSDANSQLVADTQRALASAKVYGGTGDGDAVNCLTPALAIFQAGVQVPAIPAQDAVPATATSPAIPTVAAVPAQDPGPILLYQKYREFTLAGALTSCQAWFNGPINATAAAGIAGAATAIGGAALLAPK